MRISFSACKQAQPLVGFPGGLHMDSFPWRRKEKVVVVMGPTGTGKSRLSIDLATRFPAEIVNSDKIQVYKGLNIATNKVTEEECRGVPHHLLGLVDPNADFTALDFCHHASLAVESILGRDRLPIIAGGSNSFIKALVNDDMTFRSKYECCILCVDVALPVLHSFVSERVERMVENGLVDEVRGIFDPNADYTRGIRRAIGAPELDSFLRNEASIDDETKDILLREAIEKIKSNTRNLACCQLQNILRLQRQLQLEMHRLDATEVFMKRGADAEEAWEKLVARPSTAIVSHFLCQEDFMAAITAPTISTVEMVGAAMASSSSSAPAVAAATH